MPEISRFYGIVIYMNFRDHNQPHFHAKYGEQEVIVEIKSGIVEGKMSGRALKLIFEWLSQHEEELIENWTLAQSRKPLNSIHPLI